VISKLDRWWRAWLNYSTLGVGAALAVAHRITHSDSLLYAAYALLAVAVVVDLGYGVAIVRLLLAERRRRAERARGNPRRSL
jgi:hypothetical protein